MAKPLIITLPPALDLWGGCQIQLAALDPTTGADVSGVKVSNVTVEVDLISAGGAESIGPVLLAYASDRS